MASTSVLAPRDGTSHPRRLRLRYPGRETALRSAPATTHMTSSSEVTAPRLSFKTVTPAACKSGSWRAARRGWRRMDAGADRRPRASMGEGWLPSHADVFADSPETRALVTGPHTALRACPLVPELPMWLVRGEDILELWQETEAFAEEMTTGDGPASAGSNPDDSVNGLHPPYWAVPWVGGQGVARYILDNPEVVRGKTVLDVGSGCGIAALAAARAGASLVCANDIDPLAAVAFLANADACGLSSARECGEGAASSAVGRQGDCDGALSAGAEGDEWDVQGEVTGGVRSACTLTTSFEDMLGSSAVDVAHFDVIMAGDVCFMKGLSDAFQAWLSSVSGRSEGCVTLLGDPSRQEGWAPGPGWAAGMERVAVYDVPTDADDVNPLTEGLTTRRTVVWRSG